jgi:hypothetical protein
MRHVDSAQTDVAWASSQTLPQPPQLLWLFVRLTHSCPASATPGHAAGSVTGQVQLPFTQVAPLGHALPQLPQLFTSDVTSTQTPEHILSVL